MGGGGNNLGGAFAPPCPPLAPPLKVANARGVSNFAILSPSICSWPLKIDKYFMYMYISCSD
jgi:hypothetical protein